MEEILKKLLETELLSEETKAEISEQWTASVESFKQQVREEVSGEVRLELGQQWISERDQLIEKVDTLVAEALKNELSELQDDVANHRDLQVEMAEKLVEEKQRLAEKVAEELDELVDKMDAFFEARLTEEFEALNEDLQLAKQNDFGRKIFEAFQDTFNSSYVDEASIQRKLAVKEDQLKAAKAQLARSEAENGRLVREAKLEQVLSPLTGKKREQMALVLNNVKTEKLEESYNYFIGRVLKEEAAPAAKIVESVVDQKTTVVTGEPSTIVESAPATVTSDDIARAKRLAGIR